MEEIIAVKQFTEFISETLILNVTLNLIQLLQLLV